MKEKYLWLVSLFKKYNRLAFEDIATYWLSAPCNKDQKPLSDRTFRNWRKQIEEQFGAKIECHSQKYYTMIATVKTGLSERVSNRLMEMYALNEVASSNPELKCRILLEETPNCVEYLQLIAQAMKESRIMKMSFGNMTDKEYISSFRCAPLCIKEYQRRYYVLMKWVDAANSPKDATPFGNFGKLRLYAVDKISTLEVLDANFMYPKGFNPEQHFSWYYGSHEPFSDDMETQFIRIRVRTKYSELLDKFPLHPSQRKEYVDHEFSYYYFGLVPTREFCADLARARYCFKCEHDDIKDGIEILEPQVFMESMRMFADDVRFYSMTERERLEEWKSLDLL